MNEHTKYIRDFLDDLRYQLTRTDSWPEVLKVARSTEQKIIDAIDGTIARWEFENEE